MYSFRMSFVVIFSPPKFFNQLDARWQHPLTANSYTLSQLRLDGLSERTASATASKGGHSSESNSHGSLSSREFHRALREIRERGKEEMIPKEGMLSMSSFSEPKFSNPRHPSLCGRWLRGSFESQRKRPKKWQNNRQISCHQG